MASSLCPHPGPTQGCHPENFILHFSSQTTRGPYHPEEDKEEVLFEPLLDADVFSFISYAPPLPNLSSVLCAVEVHFKQFTFVTSIPKVNTDAP